jgi:hypothetical protein
MNNGDKTFGKKKAVREIFLDFLNEPRDSDRYLDKDSPIYQDYVIMSPDGIKIHFVLLDVRYDFDMKTKDRFGDR